MTDKASWKFKPDTYDNLSGIRSVIIINLEDPLHTPSELISWTAQVLTKFSFCCNLYSYRSNYYGIYWFEETTYC
jgi:hypothetical protein